jgi:hypothetical protein
MKLLINPLELIFRFTIGLGVKPVLPAAFSAALPWIIGVGTAAQVVEGRRARKESRRANIVQERIASMQAQRERVKLLAEARRKRATLQAQAEMGGVSMSAGAIGGQQQLTGQAAAGLSFLDQTQQLSTQRNIFLQRSADATARASAFGALNQFAYGASGLWGKSPANATAPTINTGLSAKPGWLDLNPPTGIINL